MAAVGDRVVVDPEQAADHRVAPTTTSAPASLVFAQLLQGAPAQLPGVGHDHSGPGVDIFPEQLVLPTSDLDVDAVVREHTRHRLAPVVVGVARVERVGERRGVHG